MAPTTHSTKDDERASQGAQPHTLRCEYVTDPVGIDVSKPRFSWRLSRPERDQQQTGYQIQVSDAEQTLDTGTCWDSGFVESDANSHVEYSGAPLESERRYVWRCRVKDRDGRVSPWSRTASFTTGLLDNKEWQAQWIEGGNLLRSEFELDKDLEFAVVSATGVGYYELRLNGVKVGDHVLDPGWTDYDRSVLYAGYDVTSQLVSGRNAIGLMLGNGRYNPPQAMVDRSPIPLRKYADAPAGIVQLTVRYTDGSVFRLVSDGSWKATDGPIVSNDIWDGEAYDARRDLPGWDRAGFDDGDWRPARVSAGPGGRLVSQAAFPPIKVNKVLQPRTVSNPRPGVFVFDFKQNFAGWVRLPKVTGPRGTRIRLRFAELVDEEGMLNRVPNREAEATDVFVLSGTGEESFEPRFTYHGFRYCEVTGYPGTPGLGDLEACVVHSAVDTVGSFACSNELINDIHRIVRWSQLSNLMSVPTDCPQRDERMGWMGDAQLTADEATHNFDMSGFYTKYLNDITDAQKEDGSVSDVVPAYWELYPSDPAWGTATVVLPWTMYQHYGDTRILEQRYETMKRWVEFLRSQSKGDLIEYGKFGDWCPPQQVVSSLTPIRLTSTWHYYHDALILSRIAALLGRSSDAEEYAALSDRIKDAFNSEFLSEGRYSGEDFDTLLERMRNAFPARDSGESLSEEEERRRARNMMNLFAPASQTANALPLALSMVPEAHVQPVIETLISDICDNRSFHLNTGIVGTRHIFEVLTRFGHAEVGYRLATQDTYPSWGYMLKEGATTLWERWEKLVEGGMNSHNHIMYGTVDSWFYRALAGINRADDTPGFRRIRIRPYPVGDLRHVEASLETDRGTVRSAWQRTAEGFDLSVTVPVGSEAEIWIAPRREGGSRERVEESGQTIWDGGTYRDGVEGIHKTRLTDGWVVVTVGSGDYSFRAI